MYGGANGFLFLKSADKRKNAVYKAYSNTAFWDPLLDLSIPLLSVCLLRTHRNATNLIQIYWQQLFCSVSSERKGILLSYWTTGQADEAIQSCEVHCTHTHGELKNSHKNKWNAKLGDWKRTGFGTQVPWYQSTTSDPIIVLTVHVTTCFMKFGTFGNIKKRFIRSCCCIAVNTQQQFYAFILLMCLPKSPSKNIITFYRRLSPHSA